MFDAGGIRIGYMLRLASMLVTGKVSLDSLKDTNNISPRAILYRAAALLWTGNEARRVDHRRAHPKVPLAPARGSVLILG